MAKLSNSRNNTGFSVLELLLILIIVGLIGGVGWYVYSTKNTASNTYSSLDNPSKTKQSTTQEFTSKQFGFKFSYPIKLGAITIEKSYAIPTTGFAYNIRFGASPKISAGFVSKDWTPSKLPGEQDINPGFVKYDDCQINSTPGQFTTSAELYRDKGVCAVIWAEATSDADFTGYIAWILVEKEFTKNSQIAGLKLSTAPIVINDTSEQALLSAFSGKNSYNKQDFVNLAKSIQEL